MPLFSQYNVDGAQKKRFEGFRKVMGPFSFLWWVRNLEGIIPFFGMMIIALIVFEPSQIFLAYFFGPYTGFLVFGLYFGAVFLSLASHKIAFPYLTYGRDIVFLNIEQDEHRWASLTLVLNEKPLIIKTHEQQWELRQWPTVIDELPLPPNGELLDGEKTKLPEYFWRPYSLIDDDYAWGEFWRIEGLDAIKTINDPLLKPKPKAKTDQAREDVNDETIEKSHQLKMDYLWFTPAKRNDSPKKAKEKTKFRMEWREITDRSIHFIKPVDYKEEMLKAWEVRTETNYAYLYFSFDPEKKADGTWINEIYMKVHKEFATLEKLFIPRPEAIVNVKGVIGSARNLLWGVMEVEREVRGVPFVTSIMTRETRTGRKPQFITIRDVENVEHHLARLWKQKYQDLLTEFNQELKHTREYHKRGLAHERRRRRRREYFGFDWKKTEYRSSIILIVFFCFLTMLLTKFGFFNILPIGPKVKALIWTFWP